MGVALVTDCGGAPFDVMAGASLFWQPANATASAAPAKMDRDTLFIIHTLEVDQQKHLHTKTECADEIQSKSGALVIRHSEGHKVLQSGTLQSTASSQALASRFDNASALALRAESSVSPNLIAVDWPTVVLRQVIQTTRSSRA
jgi:hypothetical protein